MTPDLERALRRVLLALDDEGRVPTMHREIAARHAREWPTLHNALADLRVFAARDGVGPPPPPPPATFRL